MSQICSNFEIMARGGNVILITDKNGEKELGDIKIKKIVLPIINEFVQPILYALPVQLIAYFVAREKKERILTNLEI